MHPASDIRYCVWTKGMPTVGEARACSAQELKRAHIKSPSLDADLLLAFVLGWDRVRVLSHPEEFISNDSWTRLQDLVLRRAKGEPLQYLTGEKEFYGLGFFVGPGVLIPRPETEVLIEKAINLIKTRRPPGFRFLDIGTGSGCIAGTIAHEFADCSGWAVDISAKALHIAHTNMVRHGVARRVQLIRSNFLECFPRRPIVDFVFCNPPYVALRDYDSLPSEVRNYEPHTALFGGESGTELYREIIPEVPSRLVPGGYFLLELGAGQADEVSGLVVNSGLEIETIVPDLQGIPRCLVGRKLSGVSNG